METKNDIYTTQECDGQCSRCPFARDTPLGLLQENELSMLEKHTVPHHFMRKACTFTEGPTLGSVYMIRRGTVKVSIPGRQGKEHIVRMGGNGSIIGYQSILTENISPTTATAMTETDVCAISKSCFFSLLGSTDHVSLGSGRIRRCYDRKHHKVSGRAQKTWPYIAVGQTYYHNRHERTGNAGRLRVKKTERNGNTSGFKHTGNKIRRRRGGFLPQARNAFCHERRKRNTIRCTGVFIHKTVGIG